jgi:glycosyltransferase involved in cell wall biosynthesis
MLSIVIPTYNYNSFYLVKELHEQCTNQAILFEIIVLDDGSKNQIIIAENEKINSIENCKFERNKNNLGRARNLNLLAQKSKYNWLLFMDCDTFPKNSNYISLYLETIKKNETKIIFGGICYKNEVPIQEKILRWRYGKSREEIDFKKRKLKPFETTLTSNLFIAKEIFNAILFEEKIIDYGYEDLVFVSKLKLKKFKIKHIQNPTYHLNYEFSEVFLDKTKKALETLIFIEEEKIQTIKTKIQKIYKINKVLKINRIIAYLFTKFQYKAEQNLLSKNPSMLIFDLYKLGFYTTLKLQKKNRTTWS